MDCIWIFFVLGMLVGGVCYKVIKLIFRNKNNDGIIKIVENEDGTYLFLQTEKDPKVLKNKKQVIFKVEIVPQD